jgi:hypothetical protein
MSFAPVTRRTSVLALFCCLALSALACQAFASELIVPDNFPTITQAIASGADTVSVRQGTYPESLAISRSLVLRGLGPDGPSPGGYPAFEQPVVTAVTTVAGSFSTGLTLLDLHVLHAFRIGPAADPRAEVRGCRLDAGLASEGGGRGDVHYCHVTGSISVYGGLSDVGMNQVAGGTLRVGAGWGTTYVHDNVVTGPAAYGLFASEDAVVTNNHVSGCTVGVLASMSNNLTGNVVEDCSGSGYYAPGNGYSYNFLQNTARRCGGRGFDVRGTLGKFTGNVVDSTGLEGVYISNGSLDVRDNVVTRAGGTGISVNLVYRGKLAGNRVIGAGGDGILVTAWADSICNNVVGRSQGRGIVVMGVSGGGRGCYVHHNTVFLNGGAGLSMTNPYAAELDSINNNLSVGNAVGLQWSASYAPVLACNDWFGNATARVLGAAPSAADTTLDPLFCALATDDVSLASNSPLVNLASCGSIGALGVGCAASASVAPQPPAPTARLSVSPQPGNGPMQFSWRPGSGAARLEICDVSGARRWSAALAPGQGTLQWSGAGSDGRGLPAGIYFARLTQGASRLQTRVVIIQ